MGRYEGDLWQGKLVRLTAVSTADAPALARLTSFSATLRMMASGPAIPQTAEQVEAWIASSREDPTQHRFAIRALADGILLGTVGLTNIEWKNGVCELSIGISDPEQWGKGYGREAMGLVLRVAFHELNLHRVGLGVFAYNRRARALYESMGFVLEGTERERIRRDGARHDLLFYGLLRHEWEGLV